MKKTEPTLKLTALYTLVILIISTFFSANLYRLSIQEIDHSFQRQNEIIRNVPKLRSLHNDPDFMRVRQNSYSEAKAKLLTSLFITNLGVLLLGGLLSYLFAQKTLRPIQEANDAQSRFTADASHELRTPISVMKSEIEVALRDKNLTVDEARRVMSSNIEEIDRIGILIGNLLQLARLEGETTNVKPIDIHKILVEAESKMKKLAKAKNITFDDQTSKTRAIGDHEYLLQTFMIIVDNAIKYSPQNSIVTFRTEQVGANVNIDIIDQGRGIKTADKEKIFERFYRSDGSRTKQDIEGHGLGLSIAKALIEKQKGKIKLYSSDNTGSTFRITLPKA